MSPADDLLTTIRAEIDARMGELQPLLAEHRELCVALEALAEESPAASISPKPTRSPRRPARPAITKRPQPRRPPRSQPQPQPRSRPQSRSQARPRGRRPSIDASGRAIVAALEHGSHTVAELVIVTALPAAQIRESARKLCAREAIVKTEREGRTAYALFTPAA